MAFNIIYLSQLADDWSMFMRKSLPFLVLGLALGLTSLTTLSAQTVPYSVPVSGQLYLAPNAAPPTKYVIRLVTPAQDIVFEQSGDLKLDEQGHFDIFLGQGGEELSPKLLGAHPELAVTLELDGELMEGSLPLGSVPYAKLAQEALSLQGKTAEDFLPSDHKPKWEDIEGKPEASTLDFEPPLKQQGQAVSLEECAPNQVLATQADGRWACSTLPDKATPIQAGPGLELSGTSLGLTSCADGQTLGVVSNQWQCLPMAQGASYIAGKGLQLANRTFSIASGEVIGDMIGPMAIEASHIKTYTITGQQLAANAVDSRVLKNNAVQAIHISDQVIELRHLPDGIINAAKIGLAAIQDIHIAANSNIVLRNRPSQDFNVGQGSAFYINTVSKRVGVGKDSPTEALDVVGSIAASATIRGQNIFAVQDVQGSNVTASNLVQTKDLSASGQVTASQYNLQVPKNIVMTVPASSMTIGVSDYQRSPVVKLQNNNTTMLIDSSEVNDTTTYLNSAVKVQDGDELKKLTCYYRPLTSGSTPVAFEVRLYAQNLMSPSTVTLGQPLMINQSVTGSPNVLQQSTTMTHIATPSTHFYVLNVTLSSAMTAGYFHGCSIELERKAL